jgi:hypothetical protein
MGTLRTLRREAYLDKKVLGVDGGYSYVEHITVASANEFNVLRGNHIHHVRYELAQQGIIPGTLRIKIFDSREQRVSHSLFDPHLNGGLYYGSDGVVVLVGSRGEVDYELGHLRLHFHEEDDVHPIDRLKIEYSYRVL